MPGSGSTFGEVAANIWQRIEILQRGSAEKDATALQLDGKEEEAAKSHCVSTPLRDYQHEMVERAKDENIIVVLGTGERCDIGACDQCA